MVLHAFDRPLRQNLFFPKSRISRLVLSTSERIFGIQNGPRIYQDIATKKTAKKAPVTQNAEVFESGNNSHLQPATIWNEANTKQKCKSR